MKKEITNIIFIFALIISILTITACSSSGSSSKDLFSIWTSTEDDSTLSLEGFSFGEEVPYNLYFQDGSVCECDLIVIGTQTSGTYSLNSCFYRFGSGSADPGCNALNQGGTYVKTATQLTLTGSGGSEIYTKMENTLVDPISIKTDYY